MKKLLSVFLFLFCYVVAVNAQDDTVQYDSIMNLMKDKTIPLMERYYMTGDIAYLSREHQIAVLKQLIPEAKEVEDKAVVTRLYSIVAMFENQLGDMAEAKNYLDSAFMNKGKFENNNIAGMMHYIAGIYYSDKNQMEKAHENYYQAADYFNRNAVKPAILTEIYYDLSIIYSMWQDDEGLNDLSEAMKDLPVDFPFQQILKLTIKAKYFYALYQNEHRMNLLDSVTKYNQEAFEVYTSTENPYDVGYVISDNYLHQAVVYSEAGKIKEAEQCFETGKKLMNPKKIDANVSLSYVSGVIAYYQADYELAEQHLQDGLHELKKMNEEQEVDYYHSLIDFYTLLAKVYEKQELYNKALEAARNSLKYETRLFDKNSSKTIQKLRAQYSLDEKERVVKQLTAINEKNKWINILSVTLIVLALITIVLLLIRYRSRQRIHEGMLQIAKLKQQETELTVELQKVKLEEREREFQALVHEAQQRKVQYYLEGLEVERNRLAKELHDNVSNELLAIKMKIADGTSSREEVLDTLQALQTEVRGISHDLMPPVFKYTSLSEILQDYVYQRNQSGQTELTLVLEPEEGFDHLSQKVALEIYRIVQEATGNALKHAQATHIKIILVREGNRIKLTIADNGKGFEQQTGKSGIGLVIIKERVENLKGVLTLSSVPGKGTDVIVEIDLDGLEK
ncbi:MULTISPECIES: tetratricopeptide repeat-containing sensor histidine kinase [Bacteroides]|uniref:Oxygen sensor histidine kinase NreB n=2 Tax=Pseudomonadati TaxID=3379134 RepID=A0A0I9SB34_BACFG|nr:sensor histidine kinase [Bacteroides fragilis]MCE8566826.1 sensor histidine kinase [Bacteroides fragilis]MCM0195013.1 sensor histidine kinase [Bacteroides fragilis]MCM0200733.1 sensor histidine kinase [Bacteroides fragilis]MCM0211291.1 sensor histidine kinase [Bacteroides fragilis]MCM0215962.1 sensor histidine kinase [Bacteroides fragilis]